MRYLKILLLLGSLSGCVAFEEPVCRDGPRMCVEPAVLGQMPVGTAEPPLVAPSAGSAPVQTREPPR